MHWGILQDRIHKNQVDDVKELQQRVETVLMSEAVSECSS